MTNSAAKQLRQETANATGDELVTKLLDFMVQRGNGHYEEDVTQIEHALQCAELAQQRNLGDQAVTAALFHDIGHLLFSEEQTHSASQERDLNHEEIGAALLAQWFPAEVTEPIRLHVLAKRYLCSTEPKYIEGLSAASQRSFNLQGESLSPQEQREFEQHEHFPLAIELRRIDDWGKDTDRAAPPITHYAEAVRRSLRPELA